MTSSDQMTALQKAQHALAEKRAAGEPIERLDPIAKLARRPGSLRLAVNAKCFECFGSGHDPGWRQSIADCTSKDCPLYNVRPYQP